MMGFVTNYRTNNQSDLFVVTKIVDHPIEHHHHFVSKTYQTHQVHPHPKHPAAKSTKVNFTNICHSFVAAYSGHAAFVVVAKLLRRRATLPFVKVFGQITSLLYGHLCEH